MDITEASPPRAPRLAIRAPIDLRSLAIGHWTEGWTINISRSGVLFAMDREAARPGEDLEFVIHLSRGAFDGPGAPLLPDLFCRGRVVRTESGEQGRAIVAASIRRQWLREKRR
jgi:hypothetical protein